MTNNIFHIDCDAFYASCEELKNPSLKNKPMAVGGLSNKSIITTANYEARKYGIHSAMPVFMAKQLCKDLIIVPVDRSYYKKKSDEVFSLVKKYSKIMEQVSIDEAYIKVESDKNFYQLAKQMQEEILKRSQIGTSIGISYNKFLAKIASDWKKPMGITLIDKKDLPDVLLPLDISKVHGIGSKTCKKLKSFGIYKIADLIKLDEKFLKAYFGKNGTYIYQVIRGIDNRPVEISSKRKSMARERTFRVNTKNFKDLHQYIDGLADDLEKDLEEKNLQAKSINLKIKYDNFEIHCKSLTLQEPINKSDDIKRFSKELLNSFTSDKYFRLIGISLSKLSKKDLSQLSFLE